MSLLTHLKNVGKTLADVEVWVKDGVNVLGPILGAVDPPLAPIIAIVEKVLAALPAGTTVTADTLKSLVTSTATTQGATCSCCASCSSAPPQSANKAVWPSLPTK